MRLTMDSTHSMQTLFFPLVHYGPWGPQAPPQASFSHFTTLSAPPSLFELWQQPATPAWLCSMASRLLLTCCARRHCGKSKHLSFLPDHHLNLLPILGKFPTKQSLLSLYKWKVPYSFQACAGNSAIPSTKRWTMCLIMRLALANETQMWYKQRLEKQMITGVYCC